MKEAAMGQRKLKVSITGPCEVCGDLDSAFYEDTTDGAIVVACSSRHAEIAIELEDEIAEMEIATLLTKAPNAIKVLQKS